MLKLFTIHDSKAEAFIQPFFSPATGAAIRSFERAVNDDSTDFSRYPSDYTLFEIGEFDTQTGRISTLPTLLNLGLAATFKEADTPNPLREISQTQGVK